MRRVIVILLTQAVPISVEYYNWIKLTRKVIVVMLHPEIHPGLTRDTEI